MDDITAELVALRERLAASERGQALRTAVCVLALVAALGALLLPRAGCW